VAVVPAPNTPVIGTLTISDAPDATGTKPTLTWDASSKASSYTLIVSKEEDCSQAILTYSSLTATAQQLSFLSEGTYYAYVKAVDGNGNEVAESKYFEFDIKAISLASLGYVVGAGANNLDISHWEQDKLKGIEFYSTLVGQNVYRFNDGFALLLNGVVIGFSTSYAKILGWTN